MHSTCPTHLILLDLMTLICGEENRPCSLSSCNFLQPHYFLLLRSKYLPHHPTLRPSAHVLPLTHHHHHYPHHRLYSPGLALLSSSLNEKGAPIKGFLVTMITIEYGTSDMSSFWHLEFWGGSYFFEKFLPHPQSERPNLYATRWNIIIRYSIF